MSYGQSFHDNQPITWWKRVPIYATTILTAFFALCVVVCTFFKAQMGASLTVEWLGFNPHLFFRGAVWQIFTFPFVSFPDFFVLFQFFAFYQWGSQVEAYIGRKKYWQLLAAILLIEVLVTIVFGGVAFGSFHLTVGLLIAFATLYPNIDYLFGWFPLKWFAAACIFLQTIAYISDHAYFSLILLYVVCATSFGFLRWTQRGGDFSLPKFRMPSFRPRPKLRVVRDEEARSTEVDEDDEDDAMAEVNALLDKIAKSGIGSLSAKERARLEKAREELMKRETPGR